MTKKLPASTDARMLLRAIRKGDVTAFFAFGDYLEEQSEENDALLSWREMLQDTKFYTNQQLYSGWDGDLVDVYYSIISRYLLKLSRLYRLGWRLGLSYEYNPKRRSLCSPFIAAMIKFHKERIRQGQS